MTPLHLKTSYRRMSLFRPEFYLVREILRNIGILISKYYMTVNRILSGDRTH